MTNSLRLALCLVVLPLLGAAAPARDAYQRCLDASSGGDVDMKLCGRTEMARQDKVLNGVYGTLRGLLTPPLRADLQAAERAWLAFRAAQCDFDLHQGGNGTGAGLLYQSCVIDLTNRRIQDLRERIETERVTR